MQRNEHTLTFFIKGILNEKSVIRILIISNCILILFFIGMKFNGYLETKELPTIAIDETFSDENNTSRTDNYEIKVDINTDNLFLLCQLPGIGEAKASAILEYRRENGDFTDIDELLNVPGIGESIYNNIKDFVYVAPAISENETTE